ncbi:Cell division control protein 45 [Plasmodiophora brassicae]|uniref:Cell division control protein 45 n=1 Tax=Plasmodiophora brassicae TaxID=37360 RepID=A0A0G4IQS1_PLABS|nr:hypothetical protein PBRA_005827 [Plasmodiophora brassicae]
MLVLRNELADAWADVRKAAASASPVLLFVNIDCDSICACHILTSLLRMDHLLYKVVPVASYDDLLRSVGAVDDAVKSIIMINCGANINLKAELPPRDDLHVYVLDSHRPYHLTNVHPNNTSIVCLDGSIEPPAFPSDDDLSDDDGEDETVARVRQDRRRRVAEHYNGAFYEISAAALAYDLSQQLAKDDNDLLWSGIVGLTDQWVHRRISKWMYQNEVDMFIKEVFNKNKVPDDDGGYADADDQVRVAVDGLITFVPKALGFTLLGHWNLFDSMFHTQRVAIKLKVWRDSGRQELNLILAKLGIPFQESRFPYRLMHKTCKETLNKQIENYAHEYGLEKEDLFAASFTRQFADGLVVAAADMALAVSALLESHSVDAEGAVASWESNFWRAHDSMKSCNVHVTQRGLQLAVELQQEITRSGHSLLIKKAVKSTGQFRLCVLDSPGRHVIFTHPLALSKLAFFLIDAYETVLIEQNTALRKRSRVGGRSAAAGRRVKIIPFVLCSYIEDRQSYLIVGVPRSGHESSSSTASQRNLFSVGFSEAAYLTKARARQDWFDTSITEIAKDDLKPFLETLVGQLM